MTAVAALVFAQEHGAGLEAVANKNSPRGTLHSVNPGSNPGHLPMCGIPRDIPAG